MVESAEVQVVNRGALVDLVGREVAIRLIAWRGSLAFYVATKGMLFNSLCDSIGDKAASALAKAYGGKRIRIEG
jgi:hypothetical protein